MADKNRSPMKYMTWKEMTFVSPRAEVPTEYDDVCCGLILRQIGEEWGFCPICGKELLDWVFEYVDSKGE